MEWIHSLLIAATIVSTGADLDTGVALKLARARANAALVVATKPVEVAVTKPEPTKAAIKSVVRFYSASWCAPCKAAKATLNQAKLPFTLEAIDVDVHGWPLGVDTIPHFEWDSPRGKLYTKWHGTTDLVGKWKYSQRAETKTTYRARWTYPGPSIQAHLQTSHGVNAAGMSRAEAEALHDSLHEGKR
jgi:thiol-disulfide isomerase/thioredoxin